MEIELKEFLEFLVKHDCLQQYITNCNRYAISNGMRFETKDQVFRYVQRHYIQSGFEWSSTPEGRVFWEPLANDWYNRGSRTSWR